MGERTRRWVQDDREMWLEITRIWWSESGLQAATRTKAALAEAVRVSGLGPLMDPRLKNNVAVLVHFGALDMDVSSKVESATRITLLEEARDGYQDALTALSGTSTLEGELFVLLILRTVKLNGFS